ncbi:InlB B-repeat-containing protein [Candidatus Nitrososphaera sp. FF02]|uniref:InlB B-repeat-containing protein n=1 Tax=Candidatus Nitrososphaera sp. FF02 TaxID=3398226 RepID=UPI0039EB34F4
MTAPESFSTPDAKYQFVQWSDGATQNPRYYDIVQDGTITAVYSAQYLLQVSSDEGSVAGAGYYEEGETATISVEPTASMGVLSDAYFAGWSGDLTSSAKTASIVMDGPKTVKAEWDQSYVKMFALIAAAGAGGYFAYVRVIKPKLAIRKKEKPPDLDWYKS